MEEMSKEIEAEIETEKKAFEKFQCYCKKNTKDFAKKATELSAVIKKTSAIAESKTNQKTQLEEEVKKHKADRTKAEKDLKGATAKRQEEKAKAEADTQEQQETLENIVTAIGALEKGLGKSFLQTTAADHLEKVLNSNAFILSNIDMADQRVLASFLEEKTGSTNEIVGILKMMKENFEESLAKTIADEKEAAAAFAQLEATLEDLIKVSGLSVEKKNETKGEVAVKIVEAKNKVATSEKQLEETHETAAELKKACSGKAKEFETRQADAANEIEAIGEAIKILDNDDALQLFNKTSAANKPEEEEESFVQTGARLNDPRAQLMRILNGKFESPAIAMLAFTAREALKNGKAVDFSKVTKMIDDMVVTLKKDAEADVSARDNCEKSFRESATNQKDTSRAIKGLEAKVEELSEAIQVAVDEIKKDKETIVSCQESMAEATEQRKKDNAEFVVAVDMNTQAVALVQKAKDKLNSYYNPQLVSKEGKEAAAADEAAFVQALPGGAPETFAAGPRQNKGAQGGGVIALMDTIVNDLNKDTATFEKDEALAQQEYESLSKNLAKQTAEAKKAQANAEVVKSESEEKKQNGSSSLSLKNEELAEIKQTVADLHGQCDFILEAFEERKSARENEIAGLSKAKAILAGAKFD